MSKDASIGWMYDGAKGSVHREDYLLGKKVDKNFEKYSDVVNTQKAESIDSIVGTRTVFNSGQSTGLKTSSLQKDIIKSEDPFVAVKVREETKRREIMDNPLMKLKLQNMLKTMMTSKADKKKEKKSKKSKKKKKKRSRSSSSSSRDSSEERGKKRRSPTPKRQRKSSEHYEKSRTAERTDNTRNRRASGGSERRSRSRSVENYRSNRRSKEQGVERHRRLSRSPKNHRSKSRSIERHRKKSNSPRRRRSRSAIRSRSPDIRKRNRSRSRSRSKSADRPSTSESKKSRQFDSHIPHHLQSRTRRSDSESEDESRNKRIDTDDEDRHSKKKEYGLVEMRKRTDDEKSEEGRGPSKEYKLIKIPTGRGGNSGKKEPRRILTDEEKAARLAEMQDNVKWRDDIRSKNAEKRRDEDEKEKEEVDKNVYAPSFIRKQMREACDDMTVEKRLQSNKKGVQRSHGYMDRSFARK